MTDYEVHSKDDLTRLLNISPAEVEEAVNAINAGSVAVGKRPPIVRSTSGGLTSYRINGSFLAVFRRMKEERDG